MSMNTQNKKSYLARIVMLVWLLVSVLVAGCGKDSNLRNQSSSHNPPAVSRELQLPYILALTIVSQLSLREVYLAESGSKVDRLTLDSLDYDLLTNLLRADYLKNQSYMPDEGRRQLELAIERAPLYLTKNPARNPFKNTTIDFSNYEPILPRYYPAKTALERILPPGNLISQ